MKTPPVRICGVYEVAEVSGGQYSGPEIVVK
jgi:hypothetical protein